MRISNVYNIYFADVTQLDESAAPTRRKLKVRVLSSVQGINVRQFKEMVEGVMTESQSTYVD